MTKPIKITAELSPAHAYALAQLCKRITFADALSNAVDQTEAQLMLDATDVVREALAEAGVRVR